jgi:agmatine/peptidylarginine deiminase
VALSPVVERFLRLHQSEVKEYDLLRLPTPPIRLRRVIPEWQRARYLVIAISGDVFRHSEMSKAFLEIIRNAIDVTDVLVLVHEQRLGNLRRLVRLLESAHLADRVVSGSVGMAARTDAGSGRLFRGSVHVIPLAVDTIWVRDYGPVFGETESGRLCVLDAIYRDVRNEHAEPPRVVVAREGEDQAQARRANNEDKRLKDDQVPTVLAALLAGHHLEGPVPVVRPPLQLWGGDLFADGRGNGFTSTNTLVMNGGVREEMTAVLHAYYGLSRVTYLEPLPGDTIKHVDMFFRPADANTFLLAEYPADVAASHPVVNFLHKEAHAALERDAALLRKEFPRAKIIRVPMPPLQFRRDHREMVQSSLSVLENVRLDPADWLLQGQAAGDAPAGTFEDFAVEFAYQVADTSPNSARPSRAEHMRQQTARWKGRAGRPDDVTEMVREAWEIRKQMQKAPKNSIERTVLKYKLDEVEGEFGLDAKYRTYLNSLHLKGVSREKVLVPSYRRTRHLEPAVQKAYQEAYPAAEIVFIPADELSERDGAIHCVTCVVPDLTPVSQRQSMK